MGPFDKWLKMWWAIGQWEWIKTKPSHDWYGSYLFFVRQAENDKV